MLFSIADMAIAMGPVLLRARTWHLDRYGAQQEVTSMKALLAILSLVIAASLHGQSVPRCTGTSRQSLTATSLEAITIPVVPVTGASLYRVQIANQWSIIDNELLLRGTIVYHTFSPAAPIRETLFATGPADSVYIVVTAEVEPGDGSRSYCSQDFFVNIQSHPSLVRNATRVVVPVAGSLRGAFNSVFKTRIRLENWADIGAMSGRIVFHPAGTAGSSSDPSITYNLDPHFIANIDDIVPAIGLEGVVGSLDIIPDAAPSGAYPTPNVRADLISVGANGGEYSASIPVVTSTSEYDGALVGSPRFLIEAPRNKRINVSVRSLADPVEVTAFLISSDRTERARTTRSYAADFYELTPLSSWFNDVQLPGDSIVFVIRPSSVTAWAAGAIILFAETDNTTNDVTLVSPAVVPALSQPVVVCASGSGCSVLQR